MRRFCRRISRAKNRFESLKTDETRSQTFRSYRPQILFLTRIFSTRYTNTCARFLNDGDEHHRRPFVSCVNTRRYHVHICLPRKSTPTDGQTDRQTAFYVCVCVCTVYITRGVIYEQFLTCLQGARVRRLRGSCCGGTFLSKQTIKRNSRTRSPLPPSDERRRCWGYLDLCDDHPSRRGT